MAWIAVGTAERQTIVARDALRRILITGERAQCTNFAADAPRHEGLTTLSLPLPAVMTDQFFNYVWECAKMDAPIPRRNRQYNVNPYRGSKCFH